MDNQLTSSYLSVIRLPLPHQGSMFSDPLVLILPVSSGHVLESFSCATRLQNLPDLAGALALRLLRQELALGVDVVVHHAFLLLLGSEALLEAAARSHHSDEWRARRLG